MKAVLRLPGDKDPECLMQEGRSKADTYCQGLCSSTPTSEQRFTKLCDAYRFFAGIHERGIENFHRDKYFVRRNHQDDKQATDMIQLAYKSTGSMAEVVQLMQKEVQTLPSLQTEFLSYQDVQSRFEDNLSSAFNVYASKGAVFPLAYTYHVIVDTMVSVVNRLRRGAKPA